MKRIIGLLAVSYAFFAGVSSFALAALPDGQWKGMGHSKTEKGEAANYSETLTVKNNVTTSEMTFGPQKFTYLMKFDFKPNDFVALTITDKQTGETYPGTGYCGSVWCHLEASHKDKFEMTMVFEGNDVYELGSGTENGVLGWFESNLKKTKP